MRKTHKIILKTEENIFQRGWKNLVFSVMENFRETIFMQFKRVTKFLTQ